jgi:hypothetical protein
MLLDTTFLIDLPGETGRQEQGESDYGLRALQAVTESHWSAEKDRPG